jgi:hypothetical protein
VDKRKGKQKFKSEGNENGRKGQGRKKEVR